MSSSLGCFAAKETSSLFFRINPKFVSVCIIYLVSAAETIGDTSAMVATGLNREIEDKRKHN